MGTTFTLGEELERDIWNATAHYPTTERTGERIQAIAETIDALRYHYPRATGEVYRAIIHLLTLRALLDTER